MELYEVRARRIDGGTESSVYYSAEDAQDAIRAIVTAPGAPKVDRVALYVTSAKGHGDASLTQTHCEWAATPGSDAWMAVKGRAMPYRNQADRRASKRASYGQSLANQARRFGASMLASSWFLTR